MNIEFRQPETFTEFAVFVLALVKDELLRERRARVMAIAHRLCHEANQP